MNCYLCYKEAGNATNPALGFCQRCGAGICERHLVLVTSQPAGGMNGLTPRMRSLQCVHCLEIGKPARHASHRFPQSQEPFLRKVRTWWRNATRPLPEPQEAVAMVERYLKQRENT